QPVGGLDGIGDLVYYVPVSGGYLQYFQPAAQRHLRRLVRFTFIGHRDTDIAEDPRFQHVGIMRADEQADIDLIAQVDASEGIGLKWLAIDGCTHDIPVAFSFELEDVDLA